MSDGVKSVNSRVKCTTFDFYFKVQNDMVSGTCVMQFTSSDLFQICWVSDTRYQTYTHVHTLLLHYRSNFIATEQSKNVCSHGFYLDMNFIFMQS